MIRVARSKSVHLSHSFVALMIAWACLATPTGVQAQELYGSIVGVVRDAQGGVLPGAAVIIVPVGTARWASVREL